MQTQHVCFLQDATSVSRSQLHLPNIELLHIALLQTLFSSFGCVTFVEFGRDDDIRDDIRCCLSGFVDLNTVYI